MTTPNRSSLSPIVFITLGMATVFGLFQLTPVVKELLSSPPQLELGTNRSPLRERFSLGDRLLIAATETPDKRSGVAAFEQSNAAAARQHFEASLQRQRNDPETRIYLNNAEAIAQPHYQIAVVVPIGSNLNIAQEMLRGVAQAQHEINATGGINGMKLAVQIVNDDNDPAIAAQVATELVNNAEILAVIGHNASNASLAAAPIYQQHKLVMISPTSFASGLTGFGDSIFRTAPNLKQTAALLAEYAVQTDGSTRIAVCYDSQAIDNVSFKDEFLVALAQLGGEFVPTLCDLSAPNFDPDAAIASAVERGAEALLITPHIDRISQAVAVARANRGRLALFSSPSLYTMQTLDQGGEAVEGLILPAPWHPDADPNSSFPARARELWGGTVNWRTATSYDAAIAIATALRQSQTREGVQQVLRNPGFSSRGAGEQVQFLPTGDRAGQALLLRVQGDRFTVVPNQRD